MTTPTPTMTPHQFIAKWGNTRFGERQSSQEWFTDLCRLVGHPTPGDRNDPDNYTFDKAVPGGFADAYLANYFGWEFKGHESQLPGAFRQLLRYQVYLKTPPLLIVSAFQLIRVQTNFPGKETVVHDIPIRRLGRREEFQKLHNIFFAPQEFEPDHTPEEVTQETAGLFKEIVEEMERHDAANEDLAKYLNQIIFCLYAENTELLPNKVFSEITGKHWGNPRTFSLFVQDLFEIMSEGGRFGIDRIRHFNGDLFSDPKPVELSETALLNLSITARKNWRSIEPSIFGTLFEAAMDASKRSQLGAHYTSADDIMTVIEPVIMKPLRQEWQAAKAQADAFLSDGNCVSAQIVLKKFRNRLTSVTVLDPACGSGNFLYIALRELLDLEREVIDYSEIKEFDVDAPRVNPAQMRGLEIDHYAAELARTALWIGYIQWHETNGFPYNRDPVLTSLDTIRQTDAILTYDADGNPLEPDWPDAEFIVGNPPFLGRGFLRNELGDEYADSLYKLYGNRLPNASDLCCYWLEKARAQIAAGKTKRAGLLATQGIRGKDNRVVLQRIKDSGGIFMARSDEVWPLAGATVHISIIGFDDGSETEITLDGEIVSNINANLTTGVDTTSALILRENAGLSFEGQSPKARFDIPASLAHQMLSEPRNVNGKPNSDVVLPVTNAQDIMGRHRGMYTINFGMMGFDEACRYESPFEYVKREVYPTRLKKSQAPFRHRWWQYATPRPKMREALANLDRFIATPRVSKHRVFVWVDAGTVCTDATDVFASADDYFFGVLHSRIHELWARSKGTQLREVESGFRYTPTTCFETFPFPHPDDAQRTAIAAAAKNLDELRRNWLNPIGNANDMFDETPRGNRTLTALYNAKPTWLQKAHTDLDAAVAHAYGWHPDLSDRHILANLLALNAHRHSQEQA